MMHSRAHVLPILGTLVFITGIAAGIGRAWAQEEPQPLEPIIFAAHESIIRCIAFSPDGKSIWTASQDGTVKQWKLADKSFVRQLGERGRIFAAVAVSRDDKLVIAGGTGSGLQLFEQRSGERKLTFPTEFSVVGLDLSPDGKRAAVAYMLADYISVLNTDTGKEIAKLTESAYPGETEDVSNLRAMGAVAFSPDGKYLAVCNAPPNYKSIVSLYDAKSLDLVSRFVAQASDRSYCLAFSPDSKLIACGTQDFEVKIFDVPLALTAWQARGKATANEVKEAAEAVAKLAVKLGADDFNQRVAATKELEALGPAALEPLARLVEETTDAEVKLRARQAMAKIKEEAVGPLEGIVPRYTLNVPRIGSVRSLAFSPDGKLVAVGSMKLGTPEGQLELWRLDEPDRPWRIAKNQPVNWLAISPDGQWVASGLTGGAVMLTKVE